MPADTVGCPAFACGNANRHRNRKGVFHEHTDGPGPGAHADWHGCGLFLSDYSRGRDVVDVVAGETLRAGARSHPRAG